MMSKISKRQEKLGFRTLSDFGDEFNLILDSQDIEHLIDMSDKGAIENQFDIGKITGIVYNREEEIWATDWSRPFDLTARYWLIKCAK